MALVAACLALTISALRSGGNPFLIQPLIIDAMAPFQRAILKGVDAAGDLWWDYIYLVGVKEENARLSARVRLLQGEVNRLKEAEIKLWRLQRLMGFSVEKHIETMPAEVVSREANNWSRMMLLNRGREDGVEKGVAVVTSQGLVGQVVQVTGRKSKVLLITDWRSSVDALVQRTRARGVVVGKSDQVSEMKYIPPNADVRIGDSVVSSGSGGVFPKGLKVGTVVKVVKQRNGLFQKATVMPAVDVAEVEEALVILRYEE